MNKTALWIVLIAICLTFGACGTTKVTIVESSKSNKPRITSDIISRDPLWREIEKGHYQNEDGSEIIITDENLWEKIMKMQEKIFIYPIEDFYTGEEKILIPRENINEALSWAKNLNSRANLFRYLNNIDIDDISFIGVFQVYEHMSVAYEIKNGIAYLQGRADDPNVAWNSPSTSRFETGKRVNQAVIIEE